MQHPQERQEPGGGAADGGAGRKEADHHGGEGHEADDHDEGGPPPEAVAEPPEQYGADGPEEEREGERGVRGHQCLGAAAPLVPEEVRGDDGGQAAVDAELVPLDEIADRTGEQRPTGRGGAACSRGTQLERSHPCSVPPRRHGDASAGAVSAVRRPPAGRVRRVRGPRRTTGVRRPCRRRSCGSGGCRSPCRRRGGPRAPRRHPRAAGTSR